MSSGNFIINGEEHNDLCVGIDLGTTNSVLSIVIPKPNGDLVSKVLDIPRAIDMYNTLASEPRLTTKKESTLPSCVYYREESNYKPLVGDFAKVQYPLRPHLVAKSIKSQMGNEKVVGLADEIPDKTPADISSRILEHLLRNAEKVCNCKNINDAVITVPANFDSAMCRATITAAEKAGVIVRNKDGKERPVLLSEPNAVVYDLINQIHNGEIPSNVLDLSEPRKVLVFDLGGGTLDITLHILKRREGQSDILKVDEIATNRYTLLGGDDFDERIANQMYERFINKYKSYPDVVLKLRKEKAAIMSTLRDFAEDLKIRVNGSDSDYLDSNWGDEEDEEKTFPVGGGNVGGTGYAYDDDFTKEEVEEILNPFLAYNLSISDYKNIDNLKDTKNIIYPILDVLNKAHQKLGEQEIKIDAVIMNGGMSKFYMVIDRLKEFFGFDPIVALDPDLSVARGAAIYHYYLHKYDALQDDMRIVQQSSYNASEKPIVKSAPVEKLKENNIFIEWGKNILNDSLYLGLRNGNVHEIIPTGAELPYRSNIMTGFKLQPGQDRIAVPIKSKNIDGTYRTISTGNILFKKSYSNGAYVAFVIEMGSSKTISMTAWTCKEENGEDEIESGSVDILIGQYNNTNSKSKIIAPIGSKLNPVAEINSVLQLCKNIDKQKGKSKGKSDIAQKLRIAISGITTCSNKNDFAPVILNAIQSSNLGDEAQQRLIIIARRIGTEWDESVKKQIANRCMSEIRPELSGWGRSGAGINTVIQCIYALGVFGSESQILELEGLHDKSKFLQACLYVHGKTRTCINWVCDQFESDANKAENGWANNLQFSAYSIGMALKKDGSNKNMPIDEDSVVEVLCDLIRDKSAIVSESLVPCIIALGLICDTRLENSHISVANQLDARHVLYNLSEYYSWLETEKYEKPRDIALKMIEGEELSQSEEKFLLTKLEQ